MLALVGILCAGTTWALTPFRNNAVSATDTSQTITLVASTTTGFKGVTIVNDGANEIYACIFSNTETAAACTAASTRAVMLKSGDAAEIPHNASSEGNGFVAVSIICSAGETASARVWAQ